MVGIKKEAEQPMNELETLKAEVADLRAEVVGVREMRGEMIKAMEQIQQLLALFQDNAALPPRRVGTQDLMHILAKDRTRVRALGERLDELTALVIKLSEAQ